jgi:biopolymer transport protein ExbD/biopolymer transport protein TolR
MAFDVGTQRKRKPEMNVTPLVDVVLVLLIIFLVITPLMQKQFWVNIPRPDTEPLSPSAAKGPAQIVLTIDRAQVIRLNRQPIDDALLQDKLRRVFAARSDRVLFFDAVAGTPYARAVQVMDLARGAGATTIAILTEPIAE